jgi:hypothetical protein
MKHLLALFLPSQRYCEWEHRYISTTGQTPSKAEVKSQRKALR